MENEILCVKSIIDAFKSRLSPVYDIPEIMQFLYMLFEEWMGWTKADVHLNSQKILKGEETERFLDALEQLHRNRPIQYIIGTTSFLDTKIKIHEGVLIPRPETEELASLILSDHQHRQYEKLSLLDIGTGSGCIPVAVKKHMPDWEITAIDISPTSIQIAEENSRLNQCSVQFILSNILDRKEWGKFPGYNVIVSNPPYVPESDCSSMHPNILEYEPYEALFVPDEDPLRFYSAIADFAYLHLVRPASLYLEIHERFGRQISDLLISKGFDKAEILEDMHGKNRFIRAISSSTMLDTSYWNVEH